jgi:RimJ/RimL family protein N-acetyltransferase
MLRGNLVALRARLAADVPVLHAQLHDDVIVRSRSDPLPWRPRSAEGEDSPYRVRPPSDDAAVFSVVTLADEELVGAAVLWGIDSHNRLAHLGLSLLPAFRGQGLGTDIVAVLCHYGFVVRSLHRLQLETLADNDAMLAAAAKSGFVLEGTLRSSAWVNGEFLDELILGLLAADWSPRPVEHTT